MGNVIKLVPRERITQNTEIITAIYRNLGPVSADQVITRALTEISATLSGIAETLQTGDLEACARPLHRLRLMAENLGLTSFADTAWEARSCLENGDHTAFFAVLARLTRVAERSLDGGVSRDDPSELIPS